MPGVVNRRLASDNNANVAHSGANGGARQGFYYTSSNNSTPIPTGSQQHAFNTSFGGPAAAATASPSGASSSASRSQHRPPQQDRSGVQRGQPQSRPAHANGRVMSAAHYQQQQAPQSAGRRQQHQSRHGGPGYGSQSSSQYPGPPHSGYAGPMGGSAQAPMAEDHSSPSYWVEHLATFAVGHQYGLESPDDGLRKLQQMERNSSIWAQPMVLRLRPAAVVVEDENGELVEQFPMQLVTTPTAHLSTDPRDAYNNILLFVVKEDGPPAAPHQPNGHGANNQPHTPTEMHIFQCNRVSANEVVGDLSSFIQGRSGHVKPGRRDTGFTVTTNAINGSNTTGKGPFQSYTRTETREVRNDKQAAAAAAAANNGNWTAPPPITLANDGRSGRLSPASSDASGTFDRDVNTLNRCFDDIERFVMRIQSAAIAQRELDQLHAQQRRGRRSRSAAAALQREQGILSLRAQLPAESEFVDVLQKFKLSFNLLAQLKQHIHEPNAPELLHFLFTPLTLILDACQWGLGRSIAPQVVSPLLTRETRELLENCLTSREADIWRSLGDTWRIAPEDWSHQLPPPYRPVFADGFAPFGQPYVSQPQPPPQPYSGQAQGPRPAASHLGVSTVHRDYADGGPRRRPADDNLGGPMANTERATLDRERAHLAAEKRRIAAERAKLDRERRKLIEEQERRSISSERPQPTFYATGSRPDSRGGAASHIGGAQNYDARPQFGGPPMHGGNSATLQRSAAVSPSMPNLSSPFHVDSPRQKAYFAELKNRRAKIAQVTYDRVGQNQKELTVSRGEYLEILSDTRNWWNCCNVHGRTGYVPNTILARLQPGAVTVPLGDVGASRPADPPQSASVLGGSVINEHRSRPREHQVPVATGMPPQGARTHNGGASSALGSYNEYAVQQNSLLPDDAPDYVKKRQGKRGEFRYF